MQIEEIEGVIDKSEVDFCRVYDMDTKEKVEKIFLENGISYFVVWKQSFWSGLFRPNADRINCVFRIHADQVERARGLLRPMFGKKKKKK